MIGNLEQYPSVVDSGVPWLGSIPEGWEIKRLKWVARLNPSKSESRGILAANSSVTFLPMERVGTNGGVDSTQTRPASTLWNGLTYFRRGDVIIAKITPCFENGKGACLQSLPTDIGFGSTEFFVLRAGDEITPQFLYRITTLPEFRTLGADAMTGAAGQKRVPSSFVGNFPVVLPSPTEQAAIVSFLNYGDRLIQRYVRAKRSLIGVLEEQKQMIIQRAVTRGTDPSVRFNPSSVAWLPEIPTHWEIRRNGRLFAQRNETGFPALPILEVSLRTGVRLREFSNSTRKQVMSDRGKYKRALKGDIAYNMMRMWQGAVGIVPADGLVSPAYIVARPFAGVDVRYFNYLFRTAAYKAEIDAQSRGIVKDRNRLYWEDFKQMSSPYPPFEEQGRIADHIDESTQVINTAILGAESEIALAREYRTRLITDVVTGKVDVRQRAATFTDDGEDDAEFSDGQDIEDDEELNSAEDAEETLDEVTLA
jgi:type I restriction enzyme S subunit